MFLRNRFAQVFGKLRRALPHGVNCNYLLGVNRVLVGLTSRPPCILSVSLCSFRELNTVAIAMCSWWTCVLLCQIQLCHQQLRRPGAVSQAEAELCNFRRRPHAEEHELCALPAPHDNQCKSFNYCSVWGETPVSAGLQWWAEAERSLQHLEKAGAPLFLS